jgi:hypothetical protein
MEWTTILGIIVGNAALYLPVFFWMRAEANSDRRDIINLIVAIKDELKDFHGRLCTIEEKKRGDT